MANFASPIDSLHVNEVEETIIDITQIKEEYAKYQAECCIYKVPKRLRKVMEQAYTPKLISIGPVHHDNDELKGMQELKKSYFKEFFSRTGQGQKKFASIVKKNIKKIRDCYALDISLPERDEDLVKMILLDAIFIIELFLKNGERTERQWDYLLNKPWLRHGISQDLILLENQLPYFILILLYDESLFSGKPNGRFLALACIFFFGGNIQLSVNENEVIHFTDLRRHFYEQPNPKLNLEVGGRIEHLPTATKLDTAGLLFKKSQKLGENSLVNIDFQKSSEICLCNNWSWPSWPLHCLPCLEKLSCLEDFQTRLVIPQFVVDDRTEELFRNLMALEQCHYPCEAYICNYIVLLDLLINSKEDVELLVEESIIVNKLGSNEAVANLVNKLGQEIIEINSYYYHVADAANKHYLSPWNQNMASLKNVYFRDIWRGTATVIGVLVLIMGLLSFLRPFFFKNLED